jgi:hypothetical protein
MKVANPRLVRLGGLTRGAEVERGDGELLVPPTLFSTFTLSSPLNKITILPAAPVIEDTMGFDVTEQQAGALGATTIKHVVFVKGMWRITGWVGIRFDGTTNQANLTGIFLRDPGIQTVPLVNMPHVTTMVVSRQVNLDVLFERDNFEITTVTGATVAGDFLNMFGGFVVQRLM